jgi:hypothetical protein
MKPVTGSADVSVQGVSDGQLNDVTVNTGNCRSVSQSVKISETQSTFKASITVVSGFHICHFAFVIEMCVWCSSQR